MGYTHFFKNQSRAFTDEEWADIRRFTADAIAKSGVDIAGPMGVSSPELTGEFINFNGLRDEACEDFLITRLSPGHSFNFCKTERRPYDVVVVAVLLYIFARCPDVLEISSDGDIFGETDRDTHDEYTSAHKLLAEIIDVTPEVRNGTV